MNSELLEGVTTGRLAGTVPKEGREEALTLFSVIVCQLWYILCI